MMQDLWKRLLQSHPWIIVVHSKKIPESNLYCKQHSLVSLQPHSAISILFALKYKTQTIMFSIAYHASHEQFAPSALLKYVQLAEHAGFDAIHSSDHFHPWSLRQGQSGF